MNKEINANMQTFSKLYFNHHGCWVFKLFPNWCSQVFLQDIFKKRCLEGPSNVLWKASIATRCYQLWSACTHGRLCFRIFWILAALQIKQFAISQEADRYLRKDEKILPTDQESCTRYRKAIGNWLLRCTGW